MPHYAVVVKNPIVARTKEIARNVEHNIKQHGSLNMTPMELSILHSKIMQYFNNSIIERDEGDLHTHTASECPDGLPNCRNCGDPSYKEQCAAQGHCPYCGTRHGIAPDSILQANGFELIELSEAPEEGHIWDKKYKAFVPSK